MTDHTETPIAHASAQEGVFTPSLDDRYEWLIEIVAVLLLGLASLATAWSGYQATVWGGVQSTSYGVATAKRAESIRASTRGGQLTIIDIITFNNWLNATATNQDDLAKFYEQRFRPEFQPAFTAWLATKPQENPDAPHSPFAMPEYKLAETVESERLEQEAAATFEQGKSADQHRDSYVLNTVYLASVLVFAGVLSRFKYPPARLAIILVVLALLAFGIYHIIIYPVQ